MNPHSLINILAAKAETKAAFNATRDPGKNLSAIKAIELAADELGCSRLGLWLPKRQRTFHQLASAYVLR